MRRLLVVVCVLLALYQAVSAIRALNLPPNVSLSPLVELIAGGLWVFGFALIAFWLIRRKQNAIRNAWLMIAAFSAYSAIRLFIFARADYDRNRLPFLFLTMGLIIIITLFIAARSARSRSPSHLPDHAENGANPL